jgi:hypothetical protein
MRCRGLAQSRGTVPPISQRPLRRSTTYQGQERTRRPGRDRITGGSGSPRAGGSGFPLCQQARGCPQAGWRRLFPGAWRRAFLWPKDRGFPQAKWLKFSLCRVAQSFLLRIQLGVSPPPHELKFSLCRWHQAFPWARGPRGCPIPGGAGLLPRPEAPESAHCRWRRAFPEARGPRGCPLPGGAGLLPRPEAPESAHCRWLGVSPVPLAPDFSLPEGREFSFARWLGVSPSPVTVPGGERISTPIARTAQGVPAGYFKILCPSTSHPQLTLGCPPRQAFLHRVLHRAVHRRVPPARGRWISPGPGSGRRT